MPGFNGGMETLTIRKTLVIAAHALVGWALCFATIGIGFAVTTKENALIVHAIGAPIYFAVISFVYFKRFGYTRPLPTAVAFTAIVMVVDFVVVGLVILRNLEMFTSPIGTWIPFALIFLSTWLTGVVLTWRAPHAIGAEPA